LSGDRQLVVNADDFGFTHDVNAGIVEAHEGGILTATTLMANGAAFDDAVRLAREHPSLDIGVHLALVGGESLVSGRPLPATVGGLLRAMAARRIRPYEELAAQVRKILAAGIVPTHLDTHKHAHLLPPVLDAVARIAAEFRVWWVRRPFDYPAGSARVPLQRRLLSRVLRSVRRGFHRKLAASGCRTTDHFAGFGITGLFQTAELVELIRRLPPGTTELMCHPGRCGGELQAANTRLKESRERELRALTASETRAALNEAGVRLVSYRELSA
jgi:predicted glycoside hydrolase/deacetylase ChbG (UPF0249 family)